MQNQLIIKIENEFKKKPEDLRLPIILDVINEELREIKERISKLEGKE
jgi:hypothetical protein